MLALEHVLDDDGGGAAAALHVQPLGGASPPLTDVAAADDDVASTASAEPDDDDDDDWEDVGDEPVFRDLQFSYANADGDDGDDDSEYAPSADDDDDDASELSDLEDEEEEASPSGLFASVLQHVSGRRRSVGDAAAFEEPDAQFWRSPEDKRQWVERFQAANKQHVRVFGCRIDAPALPQANAALRREKKARSAYALVLFTLCVAYLVQLVVMYAATPGLVLSAHEIADSVGAYARAIAPSAHVYQRVRERLSSLLGDVAHVDTPPLSSDPPSAPPSVEDNVDASSVSVTLVDERDVVSSDVTGEEAEVTRVEVMERVESERVTSDELGDELGDVVDALLLPEEEATTTAVAVADDDDEASADAAIAPPEPEARVPADDEHEHAALAVQLCSKFVARLVKTKYDAAVKDAALRACDTAVAMASLDSALWVEARVLRGDLWSLASEFSSADGDYSAAATSALALTGRSELAQGIELKVLANRWISLFTKRSLRELRQDAGRVAKDASASAALRALAGDWLLVFRKKKQPFEVLTSTRLWTLQRLEYASPPMPQ